MTEAKPAVSLPVDASVDAAGSKTAPPLPAAAEAPLPKAAEALSPEAAQAPLPKAAEALLPEAAGAPLAELGSNEKNPPQSGKLTTAKTEAATDSKKIAPGSFQTRN